MSLRTVSVLCLLCAIALPAFAWAKPPEGISIAVDVGYKGVVHPARVNPVVVEMDNQSAGTNLSGELILEYNGYEYATKLELPTPSKKRFYLYFPCDNYPPGLTLRIRSKGYSEALDLTRSYKPMKPEDVSVVVLSRSSGSLGVLNQKSVVHLARNLFIDEVAGLAGGKVFVSYFRIDEVDYNPKFFSRADLLILGDIDYQQVTPELAEAIKACASGGTSIVFAMGRNGAGIAGSPLASVCPLQATGTAQLTELGELGRRYKIAVKDAPATFATGSVAADASVAAWAGEFPAVVRRTLGSGQVTALAFDFEDAPFKQNPGLAPLFLDYGLGVEESVSVRSWFIHPDPVSKILKKLGEANPISPSFVFLFLFAYIVLVGPLNFLILGRIKRNTLVWSTIPLFVLGFTYLGIYTGRLTRGSDNVTAYFQELHVYPDAAYMPYQTTMLVFTAERSNYELKVPDRSALFNPKIPELMDPMMASVGGGRGSSIRGFTHGTVDNSTEPVARVSQGKWTSEAYFYQGHLAFPHNTTAKLSATRHSELLQDLTGTFSLDLPFDLYNCYLTAPFIGSNSGNYVQVGNLRGKGSYDIANLHSNFDGSLSSENYLVQNMAELIQKQRNGAQVGLGYRDEVLLVGFTQDIEAMAQFDAPHVEHKLNAVVVHLPYRAVIAQTGPPEVTRQQLEAGSGFKLARYSAGIYSEYDYQEYSFAKDGFFELSCEIGGQLSSQTAVHLTLYGRDMNGTEFTEFSRVVEVSALEDGRWLPLRVPAGDSTLRIPLQNRVGADHKLRLRVTALGDCVLRLPRATIPR